MKQKGGIEHMATLEGSILHQGLTGRGHAASILSHGAWLIYFSFPVILAPGHAIVPIQLWPLSSLVDGRGI